MSGPRIFNYSIFIITLVLFLPQYAFSYVPPGAGLSAIGAFIAVVVGIIVAIFGFLWYPIKRLFRGKKNEEKAKKEG